MARYIARRLLQLIPTMIGISIIVFIAIRLIPGDPAVTVGGMYASEETLEQIRSNLGLDRPVVVQYFIYMQQVFTGDFGESIRSGIPVWEEWKNRFPETMKLALTATVISIIVGMFAGIVASRKPYSWFDNSLMAIAISGVSVPVFWLGLMLILLFSVNLGWFPTSGSGSWKALVLPSLTLAASPTAIVARQIRSDMLEISTSDFVRTARAKGLSDNSVVYGHALRNALVPTVTVMGLQFGNLMAGAVITETVFAWPGLGRLLVDAINFRDFVMVQSTVMLLALMFVLVNLLIDICYYLLDPRMRRTS